MYIDAKSKYVIMPIFYCNDVKSVKYKNCLCYEYYCTKIPVPKPKKATAENSNTNIKITIPEKVEVNVLNTEKAKKADVVPVSENIQLSVFSGIEISKDEKKEFYRILNKTVSTNSKEDKIITKPENIKNSNPEKHCGLLNFRKWWELVEVDISVCGKIITGIPIFIDENTMRVINSTHSYFIPLEKVDYISTADGLCSSFHKNKTE